MKFHSNLSVGLGYAVQPYFSCSFTAWGRTEPPTHQCLHTHTAHAHTHAHTHTHAHAHSQPHTSHTPPHHHPHLTLPRPHPHPHTNTNTQTYIIYPPLVYIVSLTKMSQTKISPEFSNS